jgi:2-hydroxy-3-keto-5-methylthiopentenyl-1-phosphate phosphatase
MIKIFTDFDGTITLQDVGDAMFETFGGEQCRQIIQEYRDEKISAVECFRRECAACSNVNVQELHAFLDRQEIDTSFIDFVGYCRLHQFDCYIVSDGMDYYIRHILNRHGVGDVPFFSNVLHLLPVGGTSHVRFDPEFPFTDEMCDRCACCKRNHLLTMSGDEDIIVYVGEGYSDRCPAKYADIVFAKDELLKYCQEENISYYEYHTFGDIMQRLDQLQSNGLRKRRQAERARRDVFIGE